MIRLKCLRCGLTVAHKESASEFCPRYSAREEQAVRLLAVSDQPAVATGRSSMGRLRIQAEVQGSRHTLTLSGELDIASAQILDETLAEACSEGATEISLDLGGSSSWTPRGWAASSAAGRSAKSTSARTF